MHRATQERELTVGIFEKITSIFKPAADLVDALHTSDDERLKAKAILLEIQTRVVTDAIAYEAELLRSQASVITAEAKSDSWITRSWRPITMLTFVALIVWSQFTGAAIPDQMWPLLTIGIGGYMGGRTLEKTVPGVVAALKKKEEA